MTRLHENTICAPYFRREQTETSSTGRHKAPAEHQDSQPEHRGAFHARGTACLHAASKSSLTPGGGRTYSRRILPARHIWQISHRYGRYPTDIPETYLRIVWHRKSVFTLIAQGFGPASQMHTKATRNIFHRDAVTSPLKCRVEKAQKFAPSLPRFWGRKIMATHIPQPIDVCAAAHTCLPDIYQQYTYIHLCLSGIWHYHLETGGGP